MSILQPFLAQNILPTDVLPETWHWMGLTAKELLTVLGSVAIVTLLLFVWAAYIRRGPRRRSHRHHHHHYQSPALTSAPEPAQETDANPDGEKRYRRKRRRRREHRPRNPTLAETGGLPPARSDRPQDPLP